MTTTRPRRTGPPPPPSTYPSLAHAVAAARYRAIMSYARAEDLAGEPAGVAAVAFGQLRIQLEFRPAHNDTWCIRLYHPVEVRGVDIDDIAAMLTIERYSVDWVDWTSPKDLRTYPCVEVRGTPKTDRTWRDQQIKGLESELAATAYPDPRRWLLLQALKELG